MLDTADRQDVLDAIPAASAILDEHGIIVAVNRAWMRFAEENGGEPGHYVGRNYLQVCTCASGECSAEAAVVAKGLREALAGGGSFRCEYPCHSPTEYRWFEVSISPMPTSGGRMVLVIHHDISRRRRQQEDVRVAVRNSDALAALVVSSTDAIISCDLEGRILTWNPAAEALYGWRADEIAGQSMEVLYPEGWPVRVGEYRDRIVAEGTLHIDVVRRTRSGEHRDIAISAAPVRSPDGEVLAILNTHRDITEEKAARDRLNFVTRELSHRAKNLLAVVLSIERQTARGAASLEGYRDRFSARLRSLAKTVDLLSEQSWGEVSMERLAQSQLSVIAEPEDESVRFGGPSVMLHAETVEAVGMGLHELGTNALKHGALSPAGGEILLSWRIEPEDGDRVLVVEWAETSPGIAGPPQRTGFGHAVVTRLTEQKLGAKVRLDFAPGRLIWTTRVPSSRFSTD